ncbi:MAG: putative addiction module antidote protein [Stagnimonas sp.]|nr:putative addiction module antidote protein [Stagnimonas sp.]
MSKKNPLGIATFDIAEHLGDEDAVRDYLAACLEDGDTETFLRAVGHVARARGMAEIAARSGLGRESLYKTLAPDAKPRFETISKLMAAFGLKLTVASA